MNKKMIGASTLFLTGTIVGTIISFQEDLPGEPFGYRAPGRVLNGPAGRLIAGSGISAPWLMPITCMVAAICGQPHKRWPKRTLTTVAGILTIGQLSEPVSWGLRSRKPHVLGMTVVNLLTAGALFASVRKSKKNSAEKIK